MLHKLFPPQRHTVSKQHENTCLSFLSLFLGDNKDQGDDGEHYEDYETCEDEEEKKHSLFGATLLFSQFFQSMCDFRDSLVDRGRLPTCAPC